jgi:hypothetical protein
LQAECHRLAVFLALGRAAWGFRCGHDLNKITV